MAGMHLIGLIGLAMLRSALAIVVDNCTHVHSEPPLQKALHHLLEGIIGWPGPDQGCSSASVSQNATAERQATIYGIVSWPQYANLSDNGMLTVNVEGIVSATPPCALGEDVRANFTQHLLKQTGDTAYQVPSSLTSDLLKDETIKMSLVSASWLSRGIQRVRPTIEYLNQTVNTTIETNQFGHFGGSVKVPTDSGHNVTAVGGGLLTLRLRPCYGISNVTVYNASFLVVPPRGLTVVSDVDDILREAEIWDWQEAIKNLFIRNFVPWTSINTVYAEWMMRAPNVHFHYYSDAPEMAHQYYVAGLSKWFPPGSYGFRPTQLKHLMSPRYQNIKRLIQSFPEREFILVGDTATGSTLSAYSRLAKEFPQVQCILIRDVESTELADWYVPNLKALSKHPHRLFSTAEEMRKIIRGMEIDPDGQHRIGCGNYTESSLKPKYHGFLSSWVLTLWGGATRYMQCLLQFEFRPTPRCSFDHGWGNRWPDSLRSLSL